MKVENVTVDSLAFDPANVRKHDERNIAAIAASLQKFGQQKPIVVGPDGVVIAGNGTLEAARSLDWKKIAIVRTTLEGAEAIAYAIADNRTAELAEWDEPELALILDSLNSADMLAETGFSDEELAEMLSGLGGMGDSEEPPEPQIDKADELNQKWKVERGQIWQIGPHRLMCGDSTSGENVGALMDGKKADICFTSPPYGQQRDYGEAKELLNDWNGLMRGVFNLLPMADSGQVFVNLGMIHKKREWLQYWDPWVDEMRDNGWLRFGLYVWDQGPGMPGEHSGRFAPSFELIFHFTKRPERAKKTRACAMAGKVRTGKGQRAKGGEVKEWHAGKSAVQSHAVPDSVVRVNRQGAMAGAKGHPAPYPPGLPAVFIGAWYGLTFDPFIGSGTTMAAAQQLGRTCYGMELEPKYCAVILERLSGMGLDPQLVTTVQEQAASNNEG